MKNKKIIILSLAFLITTPLAVFAGVKYDQKLTERMKGKILLQVESHGEAWYVNPKDGKRYYMKDGDSALQIMRKFGDGIKTSDLEKIEVGIVEINNTNSKATESQAEAKKQTAWTLTQTFTGTNDLNTTPFILKNGSWFKVKYTYTPSSSYDSVFGVVLKDPVNVLNSAVLANEMVDSGKTITTENNVYNKSTETPFFFDVMATGSWKVEVYENL
ncbi:hypothetical protein [Flavobacterium sp.]|uniref:hypothetical protein n=1 Tax=Flavobacterium sp. TaxID=239 RepID=UPI00262CCCEB|nr:hypothetical protein [Flavobacterium sp.]MDD3005633.1 hypothetical protein [Flavobacterium sp.]